MNFIKSRVCMNGLSSSIFYSLIGGLLAVMGQVLRIVVRRIRRHSAMGLGEGFLQPVTKLTVAIGASLCSARCEVAIGRPTREELKASCRGERRSSYAALSTRGRSFWATSGTGRGLWERVSVVTRFFVSNVTRRAFLSCDAESFSFRESVCFWALAWLS